MTFHTKKWYFEVILMIKDKEIVIIIINFRMKAYSMSIDAFNEVDWWLHITGGWVEHHQIWWCHIMLFLEDLTGKLLSYIHLHSWDLCIYLNSKLWHLILVSIWCMQILPGYWFIYVNSHIQYNGENITGLAQAWVSINQLSWHLYTIYSIYSDLMHKNNPHM